MNLRKQINLHQIQRLTQPIHLRPHLRLPTPRLQLHVKQLKVRQIQHVLLLKINTLHLLVTTHQLRLHIHPLHPRLTPTRRTYLLELTQILLHQPQVRVETHLPHRRTLLHLLLPSPLQLLAEQVGRQLIERTQNILSRHRVHILPRRLRYQLADMRRKLLPSRQLSLRLLLLMQLRLLLHTPDIIN